VTVGEMGWVMGADPRPDPPPERGGDFN
jgi:hypothetical protein